MVRGSSSVFTTTGSPFTRTRYEARSANTTNGSTASGGAPNRSRQSASTSRTRLLDEARQAAVGEHLAAGLAAGAVHDLVRLVRHALQIVAADRAGEPGLAVHGEVLAQLVVRQP